jgi:PAS domain S-box-containing protein
MTAEEVRGATQADLTDLPREEAVAGSMALIRQAQEEGPQRFEWPARRRDGTTFWGEISLRAAEIGREPRVIAVIRDITERRETEEVLRQSRRELTEAHNMLQLVLDTIPVRVFWKDRELRYLGCNRVFAGDAGLESPEEIVGQDDYAMPWRREAELYRQDDRGVLETERPRLRYEEPQTTPDGERIWLRTSKLPLRDADGAVIGILGAYEDITELRADREALRQSEENLTITLNSIGDGVIATDAAGRVVRMNPVAEQLTGWALAEARGQPLDAVFQLSGHAGEGPVDVTDLILKAGGPIALERDSVLVSRDGQRRLIADSGAPIRDRLGQTAGVVLVFRDVTEEQLLQDQLRHAQKMEAVGRLAGGVAHDFNNLLQAIEGYRSLAAGSLDEPVELRECLDDIGRAVERAASLTRQLLAFSRQDTAEVHAVDLHATIADMTRLLDSVLGSEVTLQVSDEAGPVLVSAGVTHIEQILLNLALNARDAMAQGGRLTITTRRVGAGSELLPPPLRNRGGDFASIAVADTGRGIAPEIQERVFEPFFTTKQVGQGTGLGLATVYALTERLRGGVSLRSEPDRGSVFTVYLPLATEDPAARERSPRERPEAVGGNETLLLAEDDDRVRELTARLLRGAGYEVLTARDGEEALAIFRRRSAEVAPVIADVVMPRRGGRELLAEVRALRPGVPVVFSTGYGIGVADEASAAEVVISKPYEPTELLRRIRTLIDETPAEPGRGPEA